MSRTKDYALPAEMGGGLLTAFTYTRTLGELVGTWSAEVAGGSFTAGSPFSVGGVMTGGFIERAWKDPDGMWRLDGKDAGARLLRTTPPARALAGGGAASVIADLAGLCGLACSVEGGLGGFDVRSAVTGTTCAEAVLELAMLSGKVAHIDNDGRLVVRAPAGSAPDFTDRSELEDSGTELDLDGYATQATVVVTRRRKTLDEDREERQEQGKPQRYRGTTPPDRTEDVTLDGSFRYMDAEGKEVTGTWAVTTIEPLGALKLSETSITRDGVTVTTVEEHKYGMIRSKTVWRGDQEYCLFAWAERGYEIVKTTAGSYLNAEGALVSFSERTTETMTRTFSVFEAPWIDADWRGEGLGMVDRETVERLTERTGSLAPEADKMPPYAPPFDLKVARDYRRMDFGRGVLCSETETRYEARQLGQIARLERLDPATGQYVPVTSVGVWSGTRYEALATHTTPVWMPVVTLRTTYERYQDDGAREVSTRSEWCDEGAKWLLANGLLKTGDAVVDTYQEEYAKFSQKASGLSVEVGGGSAGGAWQFLELPGRQKIAADEDDAKGYGLSAGEWYLNGQYVPSRICPHFEAEGRKCSVAGIAAIGDHEGEDCPRRGKDWRGCVRAVAALEQARAEEDRPLLEPPVVGVAGTASSATRTLTSGETVYLPAAGYQREIYIDDIISAGAAQDIADTAAANILSVKGTKGLRRTVTIPYDPGVVPDGIVTSVSHDWANMRTTVSWRVEGTVPGFAISTSTGGVASGVADRGAARRTRPMTGTVRSIVNKGKVYVDVNGVTYVCSTKLVNLGEGDSVLVSFTSGNSVRGHIVERM